MAEPIELSAIILTSGDLGESDKIITFYTRENGKERAVAKGAKRSQKRFLNALEPFTRLTLQLVPNRNGGLARIESVDVKHSFDAIRFNTQHFMFATLACELTDKWTKEGDPCPRIFHLLLWLLHNLHGNATSSKQHAPPAKTAMIFFQIKLLQFVGYALEWNRCMICNGRPQSGRPVHISERGILCEACQAGSTDICEACAGAVKAIQYLQEREHNEIHRLVLSEPLWAEVWAILERLHKRHISRLSPARIHTYDILRTQTGASPVTHRPLSQKEDTPQQFSNLVMPRDRAA